MFEKRGGRMNGENNTGGIDCRTDAACAPIKKEPKIISLLKGVGFFGGYFAIQFVVEFAAAVVVSTLYYMKTSDIDPTAAAEYITGVLNKNSMIIMIFADLLVIAAAALFILLVKNSPGREDNMMLFNKAPRVECLLALGIGFTANYALNIVFAYVTKILPPEIFEDYAEATTVYTAGGIVPYVIAGVILAPIVEELIFRGFMLTRFRRAMPDWLAIGLVGIIFGVIHGNIVQAVYASCLGFVLGAIFVKCNSLYASVLAHFGFNLASLPGFLTSIEGSKLAENTTFLLFNALLSYVSVFLFVSFLVILFLRPKEAKGNGDL